MEAFQGGQTKGFKEGRDQNPGASGENLRHLGRFEGRIPLDVYAQGLRAFQGGLELFYIAAVVGRGVPKQGQRRIKAPPFE